MRHTMHLQLQPFLMIQSREKTIELRLDDEKRRQIAVDDIIEFCCPESGMKPCKVRVKALHRFQNFRELYAALPLLRCGYSRETLEYVLPEDMDAYYSPEEQAQYGVVGIEVRPLQQDDALLRGMPLQYALNMEKLDEIVRIDDNKRYAFHEDKTKIRANQGHSVQMDVELNEHEPLELLYHGTGRKYRDSILANGPISKS